MRAIDDNGCLIIKQISTGARAGKTAEERAAALALNPPSASLATGSSNFPRTANLNDPNLIEYLAKTMLERNIKPEIEVFDAAMINNSVQLHKAGIIKAPLHFNLVENLPPNSVWGVSVIGPEHVNLSVIAMALGSNVRVGVEDNIYFSKGVLATNAALVERIANIARAMGREIATPEDVLRIWGIS